ncbi:MAG: DUF2062 domain-containing protein [Nitrospirales bacterium]
MVRLESIRQQLAQVLHLQETPHRTALAFAIGVFIAFAPHYFFHIASVVFCAWAFRLNYLALFVGSFINNPWTLVPILAASLYTGLLLVGESSSTSIEWGNMTVNNMFEILSPYLFPFIVGACTLAILGALIAYPVMRWAITRYRRGKHP